MSTCSHHISKWEQKNTLKNIHVYDVGAYDEKKHICVSNFFPHLKTTKERNLILITCMMHSNYCITMQDINIGAEYNWTGV